MKIANRCFFILSLIFTTPIFSQTAENNLSATNSMISSETMHVHFDKGIYLPGETIWFKAYLYNVNEISYTSTNFYVAIYDEKGKLLQQKQYPVFEGSSNGDFQIPDTIQSTRIQFRAFTKAMIINDSSNVYEKILTVYNKESNSDVVTLSKSINLQFFPEGGQIVTELENHIAFKAAYSDGSPAMVSGKIIQWQRNVLTDDTLGSFSTDKLGLGKFVLTAEPDKNYIAVWRDANRILRQTPLPAVTRYGVSFHAEIVNKELQYTIAKNWSPDSLSTLRLLAQMGNYQVYKADLVIPNEMELYKAKFPIDSVPPGLLQLTLFDKYWNPLQERVLFINDNEKDPPFVITDTINSGPKLRSVIEISLPDTMFTNLSASIADINFYEQPGTHSIKQDILLNTQLKDIYINTDPVLRSGDNKTMDIITLTHSWKKYNWQKTVNKNAIKPQMLDNYLSLSVNYKEKNFALPKDEVLNLIITNQFYNVQPASQTSFKKTGLVFFDSAKVAYQVNKNKGLASYLTFSREEELKNPAAINALPPRVDLVVIKPMGARNEALTFAYAKHKNFNDTQTIKEVVVKAKYRGNPILERIDELDKFYTNGMFSGTVRGYQLNVIDDPTAAANNNLQDYIRFRIPGVSVQNGDLGVLRKIESKDRNNNYIIKDTIFQSIVFIDEVRAESNELQFLNMANIAYVKYIPGIAIGAGFRTSDGALYVYTKKGTEKGPLSKGLPFVYVNGYNSQKEFISPDYSDKTLLKEPDLRTTLYWNPNIIMDKTNSKVKIEYYNNDVSKKLLLTIEGVNAAGKLIHIEKILE